MGFPPFPFPAPASRDLFYGCPRSRAPFQTFPLLRCPAVFFFVPWLLSPAGLPYPHRCAAGVFFNPYNFVSIPSNTSDLPTAGRTRQARVEPQGDFAPVPVPPHTHILFPRNPMRHPGPALRPRHPRSQPRKNTAHPWPPVPPSLEIWAPAACKHPVPRYAKGRP